MNFQSRCWIPGCSFRPLCHMLPQQRDQYLHCPLVILSDHNIGYVWYSFCWGFSWCTVILMVSCLNNILITSNFRFWRVFLTWEKTILSFTEVICFTEYCIYVLSTRTPKHSGFKKKYELWVTWAGLSTQKTCIECQLSTKGCHFYCHGNAKYVSLNSTDVESMGTMGCRTSGRS